MKRNPITFGGIVSSLWRLARRVVLLAPLLLPPAACDTTTPAETRPTETQPSVALAAGAESASPSFTDREFIASDGTRLPLRKWLPRGPVRAVILALHGFNDYSHAFEQPGKAWAARGIATYAYDQRGFGAAPGRGEWAGEGRLAIDAIIALRVLRRAYPGRPVYLLGESMGGAIAILAATGTMKGVIAGPEGMPSADADGVILSAPAVWGRATMDLLPKAALFIAVRFFPEAVLSGSGLGIQISDNEAMLRRMARDPLVIKETRVDAVFGLVDLMDSALAAAPLLDVPLLVMYGAHDEVVPRQPLVEFVAHLPAGPRHPRRFAYYPAGYHLLLRDLGGGLVARDVASWIFEPRAPLPSNADAAGTVFPWPPAPEHASAPEAGAGVPGALPNGRAECENKLARGEPPRTAGAGEAWRDCAAAALAPPLANR